MNAKIIDLTLPIHDGMATRPTPWRETVEINRVARLGIEGREARRLIMGTHTGTHCNAPSHTLRDGTTVDQLPLDVLVGPARVVDLSGLKKRQILGVPDIRGRLGNVWPERLVLRFDWCQYFGGLEYYTDHPFFIPQIAEWLLKTGVRLVATDLPQLDNPSTGSSIWSGGTVKEDLLAGGVILVESLCNLRQLPHHEVNLTVLPLRIAGGDGSPARVVAEKTRARKWAFKAPGETRRVVPNPNEKTDSVEPNPAKSN